MIQISIMIDRPDITNTGIAKAVAFGIKLFNGEITDKKIKKYVSYLKRKNLTYKSIRKEAK